MNKSVLAVLATLWAGLAATAQPLPPGGILLDSYAAIVNNKVITVGDVLGALRPVHGRLAATHRGHRLEEATLAEYDTARDTLVEAELILLDFEMQGGTLPDRAIEDHVNSVILERFQNDRTALLRALAEERLTFAEWRRQMKDQLVVRIMRQRDVGAKIFITPLDLQIAYEARKDSEFSLPERVRLRTLAFGGGPQKDSAAARRQATAFRKRVLAGEAPFAATADAVFGGDDESLDIASLNNDIRAAVADLAPGDLSKPLRIGDEIYLVQLVERQPARVLPLAEAAPALERELREEAFQRLNKIWIDSLRSKYYVQLFAHNLLD